MTVEELMNRNFEQEFHFQTARSSGPGGQHANKVSSKVELRFDVFNSELLNEEEKECIQRKLANRISSHGILILTVQLERSQFRNKHIATQKFYDLLAQALTPTRKRKPTRPTRASKEKRLENKRFASEKKARRRSQID